MKMLIGLATGVLVMLILFSFVDVQKPVKVYTKPPKMTQNIPAGEILHGTVLGQSIRIPAAFATAVRKAEQADEFCFGVTMATYARTNSGHIIMELVQDGWRLKETISAKHVEDNEMHPICHGPDRWAGVAGGDAQVNIRGVDSAPKNAVTLWLTSDTKLGEAFLDGKNTGRSMHYSLFERGAYSKQSLAKIVFIGLYALFVAVLTYLWLAKREKTRRANETNHPNSLL
jgi:hypothetical protein